MTDEIKMEEYKSIPDKIDGIKEESDYQGNMKSFLAEINAHIDKLNDEINTRVLANLDDPVKWAALCNFINTNEGFFNLMGVDDTGKDGYFEYLEAYLDKSDVESVMKEYYDGDNKTKFIEWFKTYKQGADTAYSKWEEKIKAKCAKKGTETEGNGESNNNQVSPGSDGEDEENEEDENKDGITFEIDHVKQSDGTDFKDILDNRIIKPINHTSDIIITFKRGDEDDPELINIELENPMLNEENNSECNLDKIVSNYDSTNKSITILKHIFTLKQGNSYLKDISAKSLSLNFIHNPNGYKKTNTSVFLKTFKDKSSFIISEIESPDNVTVTGEVADQIINIQSLETKELKFKFKIGTKTQNDNVITDIPITIARIDGGIERETETNPRKLKDNSTQYKLYNLIGPGGGKRAPEGTVPGPEIYKIEGDTITIDNISNIPILMFSTSSEKFKDTFVYLKKPPPPHREAPPPPPPGLPPPPGVAKILEIENRGVTQFGHSDLGDIGRTLKSIISPSGEPQNINIEDVDKKYDLDITFKGSNITPDIIISKNGTNNLETVADYDITNQKITIKKEYLQKAELSEPVYIILKPGEENKFLETKIKISFKLLKLKITGVKRDPEEAGENMTLVKGATGGRRKSTDPPEPDFIIKNIKYEKKDTQFDPLVITFEAITQKIQIFKDRNLCNVSGYETILGTNILKITNKSVIGRKEKSGGITTFSSNIVTLKPAVDADGKKDFEDTIIKFEFEPAETTTPTVVTKPVTVPQVVASEPDADATVIQLGGISNLTPVSLFITNVPLDEFNRKILNKTDVLGIIKYISGFGKNDYYIICKDYYCVCKALRDNVLERIDSQIFKNSTLEISDGSDMDGNSIVIYTLDLNSDAYNTMKENKRNEDLGLLTLYFNSDENKKIIDKSSALTIKNGEKKKSNPFVPSSFIGPMDDGWYIFSLEGFPLPPP